MCDEKTVKVISEGNNTAALTTQLMPDPYEEDSDDDKRENDRQDD